MNRAFVPPMLRRGLSTALLATLVLSLHARPAAAQSLHTWVASDGTDINNLNCDLALPCRTFQLAHNKTLPGGQITCLDPGNYGTVIITRAISIVCDLAPGSIRGFPGDGVTINAGANDTVVLRGLDIDPTGNSTGDQRGIVFNSGGALVLDKVKIRNILSLGPGPAGGGGIYFQPDSNAELYVTDSVVSGSGGNASGGAISAGIVIAPRAGGSVNASINRVRLENNTAGIIVDGTRSTGVAANATILDTVVAGSQQDGVLARSPAGHAAASVLFDHSVASGNFGSGVRAVGDTTSGLGSAFARIGDSTIVLNATGVSTAGAGVVQSFKNNRISGNLADGTPIPAFPGPGGPALQ